MWCDTKREWKQKEATKSDREQEEKMYKNLEIGF